ILCKNIRSPCYVLRRYTRYMRCNGYVFFLPQWTVFRQRLFLHYVEHCMCNFPMLYSFQQYISCNHIPPADIKKNSMIRHLLKMIWGVKISCLCRTWQYGNNNISFWQYMLQLSSRIVMIEIILFIPASGNPNCLHPECLCESCNFLSYCTRAHNKQCFPGQLFHPCFFIPVMSCFIPNHGLRLTIYL